MNKAVKTVSFIAAALMLAKILGFARMVLLSNSFPSDQLDAFLWANNLPLQFFDVTLGAAVTSAFIPVYNRYLQKDDNVRAIEFANSFITLVVIITTALCVAAMLLAKPITSLLVGGYEAEKAVLAANLLAIMMPTAALSIPNNGMK